MNLKERAEKLKNSIPIIFVAMKHKETPFLAKTIIIVALVFALSPIDLIPDFIPVIGLIDDIIILPFLISLAVKIIPDNQLKIYKIEAKEIWNNGKPKKWYYAVPFILVWGFVIYKIISIVI